MCICRSCLQFNNKEKEDSNDKEKDEDEDKKKEIEIEGSWEEPIFPEKELLKRKLLPAFEDLNFDVQHKQHKAIFSYQCSGCLFTESVQMGYALYDLDDENDQPIRMVLKDSYYVKSDMEAGKRVFKFEIENLEEGKKLLCPPAIQNI